MEPFGIVNCTEQIWNSNKAWMETFLSDNDSSSRAATKHSIETKMEQGVFKDWPRNSKKVLLKSTGKLTGHIKEPEIYLADPSHGHRIYGKHLYNLVKSCKQMHKTDADCLIRNFGYAKKNHSKTDKEFKTAMLTALEHHFDNHVLCSPSWCVYARHTISEIDEEKRKKFRNKEKDKDLYDLVKDIHNEYTSEETYVC